MNDPVALSSPEAVEAEADSDSDTDLAPPAPAPLKLVDVQNSLDDRKIKIDKVGVREIRYPIVVRDRSHEAQHTIGTVEMYVDLPHQFKGTHMSRFLEVLNAHRGAMSVENVPQILQVLRERLHAETAHLVISFTYFMAKYAPVTGAEGLMAYECRFEAAAGAENDFVLTVEVPVTTLCPCSKEISARGAHNQRGLVRVKVRFEGLLWIEELVQLVEESASCDLYPILKRQDEKFVTEKAYDNPRFVEDMVREVTLRLQRDERLSWFQVHVENFESIHAHNAYAFVEQWIRR